MAHTEHYQCAVYSSNGCFGFYRKETLADAISLTYFSILAGQFAMQDKIVRAFPPCPPEVRLEANRIRAQAAPQARVPSIHNGSYEEDIIDDIPW